MNQIATTDERLPMNSVGMAGGISGGKIAPQNLGEVVKFAEVMCRADIALPKHLRGNAGACMAVALQALEWNMSPFAVASKSYQVNGAIAYEAQLIMAVINTRSGIEGRLKFRFEGEGPERICIAYGKLDGEELDVRSPKFKDITPKNSPLWKSDPDQQHCYYTARAWGRRHTPEVILGVYDRDEAEQFRGPDNAKDVTPLSERLAAARQDAGDTREGFDPAHVARETETRSTAPETDTTIKDTASDQSPSETVTDAHDAATEGDGTEMTSGPSSTDTESASEPPTQTADDEGGGESSSASPSSPSSEINKEWLITVWRTLSAAVGPDPQVVENQAIGLAASAKLQNEATKKKAGTIKASLKRACGPDGDIGNELEYCAGVIGVDPKELAGGQV